MNKLLLFASCFIAVVADMLLVWWAKNPKHPLWSLIIAVILNSIGMFIWTYTMKNGIESATAITFYALFTVAGCSFLGFVIFNEPLSMTNTIGLIMGFIALILISI